MKRRELFKVMVVGAFSLTGLERLVKAMASSEHLLPLTIIACPEGFDDRCQQQQFTCGDDEPQYVCELFSCRYFRCEETNDEGDFACRADYIGCNSRGTFRCVGRDDGDNPQFACEGNFDGCAGDEGVFECQDFRCSVSYECGSGNRCTTNYPFDCQPPPGGAPYVR